MNKLLAIMSLYHSHYLTLLRPRFSVAKIFLDHQGFLLEGSPLFYIQDKEHSLIMSYEESL
jgi:hypothetical protein